MDDPHSLRGDLRSRFLTLIKNSKSEEKLIEFISTLLKQQQQDTKLGIKTLEVILDLTIAVVDQYGYIKFDHFDNSRLPHSTIESSNNLAPSNTVIESAQDISAVIFDEDIDENETSPKKVHEHSSYDADDEETDDKFIFPCHIVHDDCHPKLLSDYHREHLTPSRTSTQIVKLPKLCKFVIETVFKNLMDYIYASNLVDMKSPASSNLSIEQQSNRDNQDDLCVEEDDADSKDGDPLIDSGISLTNYLNMMVNSIKKLNRACLNESRNCKILSKTGMLNVLMHNLILLIEVIPDKQHIYLEPILKFVLTLADYKISGSNLKQIFYLVKNENTDFKLVLTNLERLLVHHCKILRNIQPSKSINFPTASKTPEEIEYDSYVANSWHWRLRSKVVEYKRKRSRTDNLYTQDLKSSEATNQKLATTFKATTTNTITIATASTSSSTSTSTSTSTSSDSGTAQNGLTNRLVGSTNGQEADDKPIKVSPVLNQDSNQRKISTMSASQATSQITSSWLECSLMTPLSNISPLLHHGELKFCCSMWLSVCGDMLVVEGNKYNKERKMFARNTSDPLGLNDKFNIDLTQLDGHWHRLTSRRRLVRRHKNKVAVKLRQPRKRRLSVKLRRRQACDKEDEERDELEEKVRKSDAELSQGGQYGRGRFRLFHSSLSRHTRNSAIKKQRDNMLKKARFDDLKFSRRGRYHLGADEGGVGGLEGDNLTPPRECLGRRARNDSQELLIHLVSFAIDSLTIEIWLNVKCMTFCTRACRVTREGQTNLLDQTTFKSHLESNGSWSNVMFCFEEHNKDNLDGTKVMHFKVIVNGVHEETEKLGYCSHKSPLTNFALLIGCERSTFGYVWKLSQINIYKNIPDKSMPIYLLGKGPDFWSFTNFRQSSLYPLPDITQRYPKILLNPTILLRYSTIDEEQALNWLTQNIMISYVAHQPDHFMDYSPSITTSSIMNSLPADYEFSNSAERFIQAKTLDYSRNMKFNQNNGFGSALAEAGGIESVLICFAEVIRRPHETAKAHALAFSVLLKMSQTNMCHLNKFLDELNGLKLVEFILTHPNCQVSRTMLDTYFDYCLMKRDDRHLLIKSPKLIYHLMACWRAWHKDIKVAKRLYCRLIRLLLGRARGVGSSANSSGRGAGEAATNKGHRTEHKLDDYYINHNFRMLSQAGGIDILMDVLRECLVAPDQDNLAPHINHELIELIVDLISLLIKNPPGLDVMLDIMEFLLFLHPDPKAYVEVSSDKILFLHSIKKDKKDMEVMFDEAPSKVLYTPSSTSSNESLCSTSDEMHPYSNPGSDGVGTSRSNLALNGNGRADARRVIATSTTSAVSSDDELFKSLKNRVFNHRSRNLSELIEAYNFNHNLPSLAGNEKIAWLQQQNDLNYGHKIKLDKNRRPLAGAQLAPILVGGDSPGGPFELRCSNRNYAIASIADMLASMVKLSNSMKILSDALEKPIIDARKLIILANNESILVREKVLRLFLYCIRACYSLNLKSVLSRYEQASTSDNYRICVPIHLMARQLLKYSTTTRMVKLCLAIIVGVDNFETIETIRSIFKKQLTIEIINNHLQLNTLVLLMHLITRLQLVADIVPGLQFVHAYLKRLLQLGQVATVSVLIKNDLIDCMMNLYFNYLESHIIQVRQSIYSRDTGLYGKQTSATTAGTKLDSRHMNEGEHRDNSECNDDTDGQEQTMDGDRGDKQDLEQVADELDKLLIFVERFYIEHSSTSGEMLKSVEDLMLYLDLLNTHIESTQYHQLLRDRKIKLLLTLLRYCRHYENCARQKVYGGRVDYYLKSFFKNNDHNRFSNALPDDGLQLLFDKNLDQRDLLTDNLNQDPDVDQKDGLSDSGGGSDGVHLQSNGNGIAPSDGEPDKGTAHLHRGSFQDDSQAELSDITEADVVERFRATFEFIVAFITTRDQGIIPSPLERQFILNCLQMLADYLTEHQHGSSSSSARDKSGSGARATNGAKSSEQTTHWTLLLPTLESLFRGCFSQLILYLLSPCDAMNLDERKYNAHQLLHMFRIDQLLYLLDANSQRTLLVFIKDLIEASSDGGETSDAREDDDDDTEIKLRQLKRGLEFEAGIEESGERPGATDDLGTLTKQDKQYLKAWLDDLKRVRGDSHERVNSIKMEYQASNGNALVIAASLENLAQSGEAGTGHSDGSLVDRFLDEAVGITRDVVNDKHEQRKAYLEDVKQCKIYNYHIRQQWLSLIIGHTHERAIWYLGDFYPKSWELNPVEGPSRTRRRLRPCKFALEPRFLRHTGSETGDQRLRRTHRRASRRYAAAATISEPGSLANADSSGGSSSLSLDDVSQSGDDWYSQYSPHPLCSLVINNEQTMDSHELRIRMFTTDKIHFNCDCSIVRPNEVCTGEVSIASWCIHFIGERSDNYRRHLNGNCSASSRASKKFPSSASRCNPSPARASRSSARASSSGGGNQIGDITRYDGEFSPTGESINQQHDSGGGYVGVSTTVVEDLWFDEIVEIWDRRYQLQDVGLEIFLTNNMTYLLSFSNNHDREDFKQHLIREQHKMINLQRFNLTTSLTRLTQLWRDGKLTNFDYLTCLNKLAGRSFNDLMQYPVFPFVLSNYQSEQLDLTDPDNFRDLRRPMAVQNEEREMTFKNNYEMSQSANLSMGGALGLSKPYHYGNHYSNSATVLHFLVRLPPFTQMLIQYQDNNFDQPDRTFHSIANTWQLITRDSNTDFKELIPEFFFLPEMFTNIENLELGRKQNNELVDDVRLPPWCPNSDARLFTLIHRQALESALVSENLHHWIDLIFGYKQTGKAAIDAVNVFHPATYYGGIDLGSSSSGTGATGSSSQPRAPHSSSGGSGAGSLSGATSGGPDSLSTVGLAIAAKSSVTYSSDYLPSYPNGDNTTATSVGNNSPRRLVLTRDIQADIERSALETMIKTYGQMPRQLFSQPIKQRSSRTFVPQINGAQLERQQENLMSIENGNASGRQVFMKRLEPLRQVKGLRWGSFVGSPEDKDIIAVKHKRIILEESTSGSKSDVKSATSKIGGKQQQPNKNKSGLDKNGGANALNVTSAGRRLLSKRSDKFHFCLLTNGDVAILRNNTSLMLDYRAYRKSSGTTSYQSAIPSARYSRRAGLSRVSRMNLFSNMIISRQQFSFLEPIYSPANQLNSFTSTETSTLASLTGSSHRAKFSLDSLNLVSWFYLDGTIRVKHPAMSSQKTSIPLVQANTIVDTMSTCASVPELNLLLVGYKSGSICAHIVSTSYETAPLPRYIPTISTGAASDVAAAARSASSAAPSAVHHLHTTSTHGSIDTSLLGPGRVTDKSLSGEPYTAVLLAGKTLQSVRSMNRTTRWLYCHSKRINCIKINVSFGIVVTGSDDGTSVIWDLNSLTYVRTIDYKIKSLRMRQGHENSSSSSSSGSGSGGGAHQRRQQQHRSDSNSYTWTYGRANKQKVHDYLCNCNCSQPGSGRRRPDDHNSGGASDKFKTSYGNNYNNGQRVEYDHDYEYDDVDDYPVAYNSSGRGTDYNCMTIDMMQQCCICSSGISLIAISDTLGDIVTIKNLSNRLAAASVSPGRDTSGSDSVARQRTSTRLARQQEAGGDLFLASSERHTMSAASSTMTVSSQVSSGGGGGSAKSISSDSSDSSLTSVIYVHTINGSLVNMVNCHTQVTAVTYSNAPEGISINVIVVGMADGLVRLYNSWDLSRVKEFRVSGLCSPISSILYTRDSQLMYIAYDDGQMVVLRNKKKGSVSVPKEWIL